MLPIPTERPSTKTAGDEFLPGYRLLRPLGSGGFGEVWECEAPGRLRKAVKFVAGASGPGGTGASLRKELDAFERIKAIRHPFVLVLERVELVGGELVMVMELAEQSLFDRYRECAREGLRGVPRDELLVYLMDAAEALDVISTRHGLQHLDVKPGNLFVVGGHAKLGDFGLVRDVAARGGRGAFTPRYAAPEVTAGRVDRRSDQYSLALVYQEMLTGTFPFAGKSANELLALHAGAQPDLTGLPPGDRTVVAGQFFTSE